MHKITAVIVLYFPDLSLLDRLAESIVGQVGGTVIVDNTPLDSVADPTDIFRKRGIEFHYEPLGENRGIAAAQNIGIQKAVDGGCSHVLLLDQDSALPLDAVKKLLTAEDTLLSSNVKVAAVGPAFIHEKTKKVEKAIKHVPFWTKGVSVDLDSNTPVETDCLISSGSLIQTSILGSIGPMREDLFIDLVDIEWGLRAKYLGWKSYMVPTVVMIHNLGKTAVKVKDKWFYFHNDVRHYYVVRNTAYLLRLKTMGIQWRSSALLKIMRHFIIYTVFSDHKFKTLGLLLRALGDGICGKLGRLD
jgi:rhamnosyltransferase